MALRVIFFLISKTKFEEYCQLAQNVFPPDSEGAAKQQPSIGIGRGTDKLLVQSEERSQKLRNFLQEFGKQPYHFRWNGSSLSDALSWLQQAKNIDLCQIQYRDPGGRHWILFEESLRERYLELINPANFEADNLADYVRKAIKGFGRLPSEEPSDDELAIELKEAMLDGIRILYDYLRLVDSHSVVLFFLG
jgi:hypothetical protein